MKNMNIATRISLLAVILVLITTADSIASAVTMPGRLMPAFGFLPKTDSALKNKGPCDEIYISCVCLCSLTI